MRRRALKRAHDDGRAGVIIAPQIRFDFIYRQGYDDLGYSQPIPKEKTP
jgi:hypothetical protein